MKIIRDEKEMELTQEELEEAHIEYIKTNYIKEKLVTNFKLLLEDAEKYSKIGYEKYKKKKETPLEEIVDEIIRTIKESNLKTKKEKLKSFKKLK